MGLYSSNYFAYFVANLILLSQLVHGKVHHHDFFLEDKNFTRLCATKSAMAVNGSIPGPIINVNKGDTLYVNVHNLGDYKVTIHWHGVKQLRNSWYDGPEYITQCAIKPGTNFTYEVIFTNEEGTLWWHAHNEWTRNTVHGAIVIHPKEGTTFPFPKPDGEQVLVVGSWFTSDVNSVVEEALETAQFLPVADAYTINGQPGDLCPCGNESTYRWKVEYGKTYLVRIINAAMSEQLFLGVADHNLTIVGVDASYVKPFVSSFILIPPGNTIDVLLTANQTLGHYYIAARVYNTTGDQDELANTTATATIEYEGDYTPPVVPSFPTATLPDVAAVNDAIHFPTQFRSLYDQNVPKNITTSMFITANTNEEYFNITDTIAASLNNISWQNPRIDVLRAYYYNISGYYSETFPDMPPAMFDFVSIGKHTI